MVEVSGWRSEREREAPGGGVRTRRGDEKRKRRDAKMENFLRRGESCSVGEKRG